MPSLYMQPLQPGFEAPTYYAQYADAPPPAPVAGCFNEQWLLFILGLVLVVPSIVGALLPLCTRPRDFATRCHRCARLKSTGGALAIPSTSAALERAGMGAGLPARCKLGTPSGFMCACRAGWIANVVLTSAHGWLLITSVVMTTTRRSHADAGTTMLHSQVGAYSSLF